jgi:hypothetical protein
MNWSITYKQITLIIGVLVALAIVAGMFVSHSTIELSYSSSVASEIVDLLDAPRISSLIKLALF